MNALGHLMILASAGAGKTYALTTRFLRLMARHGAEPERIVALTFTRKAAGEFFDAILNRLALAASDEKAAAQLATEVDCPDWGTAEFLAQLRRVVERMPQLRLGTMDGFFAQMVQAFPLELGISGEFQLLEEATARQERQRVLGAIFGAGAVSEAARDDFVESFKRATYGVEEKGLQRSLDRFLDDHGEVFRAAPAAEQWGRPRRVWPAGCSWLDDTHSAEDAAAACAEALSRLDLNEKQTARLADCWAAMADWEAGAALPDAVDYLFKNALKIWAELAAGAAELTLERRKVALGPDECRALREWVRAIVGAELQRKLEVTAGIHAVIQSYESIYDREVRRAGRLTFADVQRLLEPETGIGIDPDQRQLIDWRLDGRFDHWLLDEFQDTSRAQWSILRNLIDEAVQDPEGGRSFFYVGDVKQAIYGWRGGDARLFREIFDYYNAAAPGAIGEDHLTKSWRSGSAVIGMVNAVCGNQSALETILPGSVTERWMTEWRDHESARPDPSGFAELRTCNDGEDERFAATLATLREIEPARRGLTAAVLVQKNDTGARLAEYLRSEGGLAAVAESDLQVAYDNPFTCAILALLRAAAHPRDSLARQTVAMGPAEQVLRELGWADAARLSRGVLGEIAEIGFAGAVGRWVRRLEPHLDSADGFSRLRGRQLQDAARGFDETGDRDVDRFLDWAEAHTLRESDTPGVVRVMTVHKSKGLGFDVVILPDLQGNSVDGRRGGLSVHRGDDHGVDWVLDMPAQNVAELDDVLAAQMEAERAESAYEAICRLYVALTRAKQALYVFMDKVKPRSSSRNFPKLLHAALGEAWQQGDPQWFEGAAAQPPPKAPTVEAGPGEALAMVARRERLQARTPSHGEDQRLAASVWFSGGSGSRADWGTEVHRLLAQVEWCAPAEVAAQRETWVQAGAESTAVDAVAELLGGDEMAAVFRPDSSAETSEVWRERGFEIVMDGAWITGVMDRVLVQRDDAGRPVRAVVYDFKTDDITPADMATRAKRHREQLLLYRDVVARLTGLARSDVRATLVWVRLARLTELA